MGIFNWWKQKKSQRCEGFDDPVPEEFATDNIFEDDDGAPKVKRHQRQQFNTMVDPAVKLATKIVANRFGVPLFAVSEHCQAAGLADLDKILEDPEKTKVMGEHLINAHFLGNQIADTDELRLLAWGKDKFKVKYYWVNVDVRPLRLLAYCRKAVTTTLEAMDGYHQTGNYFTYPALRKLLLALVFEITQMLEKFPKPRKSGNERRPSDPRANSALAEGIPHSGNPSDEAQPTGDSENHRVGFVTRERDGEFQRLEPGDRGAEEFL